MKRGYPSQLRITADKSPFFSRKASHMNNFAAKLYVQYSAI